MTKYIRLSLQKILIDQKNDNMYLNMKWSKNREEMDFNIATMSICSTSYVS